MTTTTKMFPPRQEPRTVTTKTIKNLISEAVLSESRVKIKAF